DVAITSPTIAITRKSQPFMIYLPICVGLIMHGLQQAKFNQKKAAELLGLTYHQLRALLKKHQI
ncbi:helix-turn-helix domain-containing protein, partial [Enterobacter hormaechei subsp. xiangfangensis]